MNVIQSQAGSLWAASVLLYLATDWVRSKSFYGCLFLNRSNVYLSDEEWPERKTSQQQATQNQRFWFRVEPSVLMEDVITRLQKYSWCFNFSLSGINRDLMWKTNRNVCEVEEKWYLFSKSKINNCGNKLQISDLQSQRSWTKGFMDEEEKFKTIFSIGPNRVKVQTGTHLKGRYYVFSQTDIVPFYSTTK